MNPRASLSIASAVWAATTLAGCQAYEFVFQRDSDREGAHIVFTVTQPSKADILFVVDNSKSMEVEQKALNTSFERLLEVFATQDTSYRIGIVSTDAHGVPLACDGVELNLPVVDGEPPSLVGNVAYGVCTTDQNGVVANRVTLNRPHDGARGRLIAAYDPTAFASDKFVDVPETVQPVLASLLPTDDKPETQVPWVIDREQIRARACAACGLPADGCNDEDSRFEGCVEHVAEALIKTYFRSNIAGLGIGGFGWEEGIKSALLAVGIDPEEPDASAALSPQYDVTRPDGPNRFSTVGDDGQPTSGSWIRDDALLAIMFVTDEEDCSMPLNLMELRDLYEGNRTNSDGPAPLPSGSICYQDEAKGGLLDVARMADLLIAKKDNVAARVAVGVIAGLQKKDPSAQAARNASAVDCRGVGAAEPETDCLCLQGALLEDGTMDDRWCSLLHDSPPPASDDDRCDGLAGSRYVRFANKFARRSFESICRTDSDSYGPALSDFASIATLACFDLKDVRPANGDPANIYVRRASRDDPTALVELPMQSSAASKTPGWYYENSANRICLTGGLDRLIDDIYDIFILHTNRVQYTE